MKKIIFFLFLFVCVFAVGPNAKTGGAVEASNREIKIEAELNDHSFIITIDGKRYRALSDRQMQEIAQTDKAARLWQNQFLLCKDELTGKHTGE